MAHRVGSLVVVAFTVALGSLGACDGAAGGGPADGTAGAGDVRDASAADAAEATPDALTPVAFPPATEAAFAAVLADYIHFSEDPGVAFAIHHGDAQRFSGTAGLAEIQTATPVTATTQFRVGSNTKPITATWILMLVEEGLIDLDASVTTYLPQYPEWQDITVRHLLAMQSGLPEFLGVPTTLLTVLRNPAIDLTPADVVDFVRALPLEFAPGTECAYSNTSYTVLGMVGEAVTGNRAKDELHTRIFAPLGMADTYLEMTGDPTARLAHGYMDLAVMTPLMKLSPVLLRLFPQELFVGDAAVVDGTALLPPSLTWTAGSVVATPNDLAVFQRALQSGRLLSAATMAEMREVRVCRLLGGTVPYGLGVMQIESPIGPLFGHGGLNFGFHVETYYAPELDAAICHMHNFLPAQVVTVTDQMVDVAFGSQNLAPAACALPQDMFTAVTASGPSLTLRFKGPVGSPTVSHAGMASAWVDLGTGRQRLYGIDRLGRYADAVRAAVGGTDTLSLRAFGPSATDATHLWRVVADLPAAQFATVDARGFVDLSFADATQPFPVVLDLTLDPDDLHVTSECVIAVPDTARPARAFLCDGADGIAFGAMARLGAAVPLTADETTVAAHLAAAGRARCVCYDSAGGVVACP